jgi:glycerol-3-phosphate dehydrogenase
VFLGLRRDPRLMTSLIVEKADRDCYALIPWGPVALWGPTETYTDSTDEGFSPTGADVQSLIEEFARHFSTRIQREDIVSLRCGVRGLAVPSSTRVKANRMSSSLSRKYVVHADRDLPWMSVYGGKLTSCAAIAHSAAEKIRSRVKPSLPPQQLPESGTRFQATSKYPGLPYLVLSVRGSLRESCWTLEDYLRRRTNISQWVPRGGLGANDENVRVLRDIAAAFWRHDGLSAEAVVSDYQRKVEATFDNILSRQVV